MTILPRLEGWAFVVVLTPLERAVNLWLEKGGCHLAANAANVEATPFSFVPHYRRFLLRALRAAFSLLRFFAVFI